MKIDEPAQQILSFDGTELFWKRASERIYTSKEEKTMQAFKAVKYQYMLLSGAIVAGDDKLKLFYLKASRRLSFLSMHYCSNPKAFGAQQLYFQTGDSSIVLFPRGKQTAERRTCHSRFCLDFYGFVMFYSTYCILIFKQVI